MTFHRIKSICVDLDVSYQTLYNNVKSGKWPPLEHPNPVNSRVSGYSDDTFKTIARLNARTIKKEITNSDIKDLYYRMQELDPSNILINFSRALIEIATTNAVDKVENVTPQ